jgi:tRNA pseudouridine38-40 synthase
VQGELQNAIYKILGEEVTTLGSGRTDTGVHAKQQFVQFQTDREIDYPKFMHKLNGILPRDIAVKNIFNTDENFNVRFDAISRSYEYHICMEKNPFLQGLTFFLFKPDLDVEKMNSVAKTLFQYSDFQSFSKYHTSVNNFECTIMKAYWEKSGKNLVFHITANRFLRGMVRAIVGTLLEVGFGKITESEFKKIIEARDRKAAKYAVPPQGLYLTKILYPNEFGI